MIDAHEEIQSRLHYAAARADLNGVAELSHLCHGPLTDAAEAVRPFVAQAVEMHAIEEPDRKGPASLKVAA